MFIADGDPTNIINTNICIEVSYSFKQKLLNRLQRYLIRIRLVGDQSEQQISHLCYLYVSTESNLIFTI